MFAGVMAFYKGLGLAWKVGIPAILVLIMVGSVWAFIARQQSIGEERKEKEQLVELNKQGIKATAELVRQNEIKDEKLTAISAMNDMLAAQLNEVQKELDHHAKKKACALDDDDVNLVNRIAGVRVHTATDQRMSSSGAAAGESPVETQTTVTVTDTAALYQRIKDLTDRALSTDVAHNMLSEYEVETYCQQYLYHYGVPDPWCDEHREANTVVHE